MQYTYFQWKYLTTEHFDLYYNQEGRPIADFAAEAAENAYRRISNDFRYDMDPDDPIVIVTYQSHNDFEQTNVSSGTPGESTGGFTEFLKTRAVVPFEGNHEKFRHVIHHELTHAVMINMLYGQGFGSVVTGMSQSQVPLWFIEGLAEYESRGGLDSETEMFLRDAVVNDFLPEIRQLDMFGYLGVYKSGQSILYWIAWRYGAEKIGEFLHQLKTMRSFDRALRASIGIDQKELSKRWRRFIKERYWLQVGHMDPPDRFAQQLTDHQEEYCYVNNSPALSPNGEWLAFLSDRSDYFDVYLMSTLDGKIHRRLVHGQRSGKFEELHWLRPGITWSPDGDRIAFCAKAGKEDVLYIINVESGRVEREFELGSDALFSPSWSPDGSRIALVIVRNGRSDIAVVDIDSGQFTLVTDDLYDDADPSWSPDSRQLLFTSNRGDAGADPEFEENATLFNYAFNEFDIFLLNLDTHNLQRLTNDPFVERPPIWTPVDNTILYVSDSTGIYNLYLYNISTGQSRSITNVVTGCFQPTIAWDSRTVAFASYFNNGYDIYMLNGPFDEERMATAWQVPETEEIIATENGDELEFVTEEMDYSHFVFDRLFSDNNQQEDEENDLDSTKIVIRSRNEDGRYPSHDYEVYLTPDMVFVNASYSPYLRMQGSGLLLFSDVLGDHNLYVALDAVRSLDNSNFFCMYDYNPRRVGIGGGGYHYSFPFYYNGSTWRDRTWGVFLQLSYPISRYNRVEFGFDLSTIERSRYTGEDNWSTRSHLTTVLPRIGYVHDNSIWKTYTSPGNGGRWQTDLTWSPGIDSDNGVEFATLSVDWRKYIAYKQDYSFAFRLHGATSEGNNPQRFFLGGMSSWFNPRFDNTDDGIIIDRIEDIYFSSFVTPLRGVGYYNQVGTRYLLSNFEFRFPFIRHLMLGWPLPAYFRDVRGALFADYGAAWKPEDMNGQLLPKDWTFGFGFGIRLDLGIFPIEWDIAWSPDESSNMGPRYYFSINRGF
ncbi:MAG: BamA/TamA family outer membrane protein [Candidatus Electryoneaceae bacterium]|nr:BamA/TamA family outer membrane protein [Candidatus Electryoneaceae bacterium]